MKTFSVFNRTEELRQFEEARKAFEKMLAFEMERSIDTEGENDIGEACRRAMRAICQAELTIKLYHKET